MPLARAAMMSCPLPLLDEACAQLKFVPAGEADAGGGGGGEEDDDDDEAWPDPYKELPEGATAEEWPEFPDDHPTESPAARRALFRAQKRGVSSR